MVTFPNNMRGQKKKYLVYKQYEKTMFMLLIVFLVDVVVVFE